MSRAINYDFEKYSKDYWYVIYRYATDYEVSIPNNIYFYEAYSIAACISCYKLLYYEKNY